jgi:hypothetical protein
VDVLVALFWQSSSAVPVSPAQLEALLPPLAGPEGLVPVVPPAVVPGAPPSVVGELLLVPPEPPALLESELEPALEPDDPPALPPAPLPCAQLAPDRPSMAAVIAAVRTFIFVIRNVL